MLGQKIELLTIIMNEKTIEVSGLSFTQVDIFGCYLPSYSSIKYALSEFNGKTAKQGFCHYSNFIALHTAPKYEAAINYFDNHFDNADRDESSKHYDFDNISEADLDESFWILTRFASELCEYDLNRIAQSDFTKMWFESVLYELRIDIQKYRKISTAILKLPSAIAVRDFCLDFKQTATNSNVNKCDEYINAKTFIAALENRILLMSLDDPNMFMLMQTRAEYMNKKYKIAEANQGEKFLDLCEKCQKYFPNKRTNRANICNSCKPKWKKEKKEQKKVSRRKVYKGFEPVKTGMCSGGCGFPKRKINESGTCKHCYPLNP
jgi:hypothetical protein